MGYSTGQEEAVNRAGRDLARTRELILESAVKDFSQRGMEGARVDAIAESAGVNKAMIYYIFGSKHNLYLAALEKLFEEKTEGLNPPPADAGPMELMAKYFDAFARNKDMVNLVIHDIAVGAPALRELRDKRPELFDTFRAVSDHLAEGKKQGKVASSVDTDKAVILAVLTMIAILGFLPHADLVREEGTAEYELLTNLNEWRTYLVESVGRVLSPERD